MITKLGYKQDSEMEREALYAKVNEIIEAVNKLTEPISQSQEYDIHSNGGPVTDTNYDFHKLNPCVDVSFPTQQPISRSGENGQECTYCNGYGIGTYEGECIIVKCPKCKGTGKV
jgi:hypothetical protein